MSAVPTASDPPPAVDPIAELHARVRDWSDVEAVARACVEVLRGVAPEATVTIHRYEASSRTLVVLASAAGPGGAAPMGARFVVPEGPLEAAIRQRAAQRVLNSYAVPDFVRSLPGVTRSEVVLPILGGSEAYGLLQLCYTAPHGPSQEHEEVAGVLAHMFGPYFALAATGQERAAAQPGLRASETELLAALATHLAQSADFPDILRRVAGTALQLVPADCALVLLRHESRLMLEVGATAGISIAAVGELVPLDGSAPGRVAFDARPRVCAFPSVDGGVFGPSGADRELRAGLLVPLSAAGKTYGVLAVLDRAARHFDTEEVARLQNLANMVAAIESMRTIGPLRQSLSDVSLLAEVGRAVTGTLGLDEVLGVVVKAVEMLVGARWAAVALLSAEESELQLSATTGSLMTRHGDTIPLHGSVTGLAVLSGDVLVTPSLHDDPRRHESEAKLGPAAIVPIESGTRIHGALLAGRAAGADVPTEADIDALRKLAGYAAIAIENARLYREQTELSRRLRAQTDELELAYTDLRASQERLLVSEKMAALGRVTAGLAHEINSPLGGILNSLQSAQKYLGEYRSSIGDAEVTPEDHEAIAADLGQALTLAEQATRKVAQFVRSVRGQTRIGEMLQAEFDPADEIERAITVLRHELQGRQVTVLTDLQRDLPLIGDPGRFSLIVQNLLRNAIDAYEGAGGEVSIRWAAGESERRLLEVADRGVGIPEAIRGRVFDYLFTTKDVGQGTGLGLSTTHSIVTSDFHGEIDFESTEGVGTTFRVVLPCRTTPEEHSA